MPIGTSELFSELLGNKSLVTQVVSVAGSGGRWAGRGPLNLTQAALLPRKAGGSQRAVQVVGS